MELNQSEIDTYQEAGSSDEAHGQKQAMVYKPTDWPFYERTEVNGMLVEKRETGLYANGSRVYYKQLSQISGIPAGTIQSRETAGRPLKEWFLPRYKVKIAPRNSVQRSYTAKEEYNPVSSKMLRVRLV